MNLVDLDLAGVRERALEEVAQDRSDGRLYLGTKLNVRGRQDYPDLLVAALTSGTDVDLTAGLRGRMEHSYRKRSRGGGWHTARVPDSARATLAEGEFNRFYMRGLCRVAVEKGIPRLVVYRAKHVAQRRPRSESLIGHLVDPGELLEDLRENVGQQTRLGIPGGPGSALSVRVPG